MARGKVPVSMRAVTQRINRKLEKDNKVLKAARGDRLRAELGDYFIVNLSSNMIQAKHQDVRKLARELGVLMDWEELLQEDQ